MFHMNFRVKSKNVRIEREKFFCSNLQFDLFITECETCEMIYFQFSLAQSFSGKKIK